MKDITRDSTGGQTDTYEQSGNEKREKEIEKLKPNGEQDRIDQEEARINSEPEKDDDEGDGRN